MSYRWGKISQGEEVVADKVELKAGEYDVMEAMWRKCFMEETLLTNPTKLLPQNLAFSKYYVIQLSMDSGVYVVQERFLATHPLW